MTYCRTSVRPGSRSLSPMLPLEPGHIRYYRGTHPQPPPPPQCYLLSLDISGTTGGPALNPPLKFFFAFYSKILRRPLPYPQNLKKRGKKRGKFERCKLFSILFALLNPFNFVIYFFSRVEVKTTLIVTFRYLRN